MRQSLLSLFCFLAAVMVAPSVASLVEYDRSSIENGLNELPGGYEKGSSVRYQGNRALKGSKGSSHSYSSGKGKGSKGSKGSRSRSTLRLFARRSEINAGTIEREDGYTALFPLYDRGQEVGRWYESVIFTSSEGRDGFGSVSMTFNRNSILSLSTVSTNNLYPITGGSGAFQRCVSGFGQVAGRDASRIFLEFNIFETC